MHFISFNALAIGLTVFAVLFVLVNLSVVLGDDDD